jgi:non-ribosomal peptide synthetase component F
MAVEGRNRFDRSQLLARIGENRVSALHVQPGSRFVEFKREETEQSVPERFEKQAVSFPSHVAVKTKLHDLTYAEFNNLANQIARAINQQPGGHESVALLLEHDAPAIVSEITIGDFVLACGSFRLREL